MRREICWSSVGVACAVMLSLAAPAGAVPYASMVRNTGGTNFEFVLNEAADSVTIQRTGDTPVVINTPAAGRYTFSATGAYQIEVSKNASAGWSEISSASNLWTNYQRPTGLAVNTNPASPYFGTIYVGNANPVATLSGRQMGDGIYALSANMIGLDPVTKLALADPNDVNQAKAPGWTVAASTNSPYRFNLDASGNLIVGDWSDANGGIKYASPDLATGGLVLAEEDGIRPLLLNSNNQEMHGSIVSRPYTTGSVGVDLTVYGMDEDYDIDGDTLTATVSNSLWKWTPGAATSYDQPPQLVVASNSPELDADPVSFFDNVFGVQANAFYNPSSDKWYITQARTNGTESSLIVVNADGAGADLATPLAADVLWSSKGFSVEKNLDGFTDDPATAVTIGIQDVFRESQSISFSLDNTKMFVHRTVVYGTNPTLGTADAPGAVLVIPLDANGLPDLTVSDNGTPGDTTDDVITNITSIPVSLPAARQSVAEVYTDAAGNVYITRSSTSGTPTATNSSQLLQVFSPGGNTKATTSSAGTFSVETLAAGSPGDFDGNGLVDARDYTVWRDHLGAADESSIMGNGDGANGVDAADYLLWKNNFGAAGSGALAGAVPEPASAGLLALGMLACLVSSRRGRKAGA